MMWGYGWDMGLFWVFGLMLLAGLTLLVVLAVRVFSAGRQRGGDSGPPLPMPGPSRARQILDERYAKGELTAEQYRNQIRVLSENP